MKITLRSATDGDIPRLAEMNRQLCDDERSRNPMTIPALANRMREWLAKDWQGVLFEIEAEIAGYSVFQVGADYYEPSIPEVYIRQFLIVREHRGRGLGRQAFRLLESQWFPPGSQIHLDVLATNPRGERFWESLGFGAYSVAMRKGKPGEW